MIVLMYVLGKLRNHSFSKIVLVILQKFARLILSRSPGYIVTTELDSEFLTIFIQKSPSFGHSYSTRNILARFVQRSPSFGHSCSTRNIVPTERLSTLLSPYMVTIIFFSQKRSEQFWKQNTISQDFFFD